MRRTMLRSMFLLVLLSAILSACGTPSLAQSGNPGQIPTPPPAPTYAPEPEPAIPAAPAATLPRAGAQTLAADTFDSALDAWDVLDLRVEGASEPSLWQATNGRVDQVTGPDGNRGEISSFLLKGDLGWGDYSVRAAVYPRGNGNVGLVGRASDAGLYVFGMRPSDSTQGYNITLHRYDAATESFTLLSKTDTGGLKPNAWAALELRFQGDSIQALIDGKEVLTATDGTHKSGRAGLYAYAEGNVSFDNFSVQTN
ncbi:MAG TPA: family 16 glycoside hydrolase [Herpetosiphonaceae bacterium]|nr:family 16 glycoside hydrolase [Herpetosiphonaceae bacterium]